MRFERKKTYSKGAIRNKTVTRKYKKKDGTVVVKTYDYSNAVAKGTTRQGVKIITKTGNWTKKGKKIVDDLRDKLYYELIASGNYDRYLADPEEPKNKFGQIISVLDKIDRYIENYKERFAADEFKPGVYQTIGTPKGLESSVRFSLDRDKFDRDDIFLNNQGLTRQDFIDEYNEHTGSNYSLDELTDGVSATQWKDIFSADGVPGLYSWSWNYEGESPIIWEI